jgi:hypothetical protein
MSRHGFRIILKNTTLLKMLFILTMRLNKKLKVSGPLIVKPLQKKVKEK